MDKQKKPKLSVIIPCYNLGEYVLEAVQSVLEQSWTDFEVIIVDDGSRDSETIKTLDSINHPKVRLLRTENQGLPSARNTGITQSLGDYICCLDADDRLEGTYLEKTMGILEEDTVEKIGFVTSWVQLFGGENKVWKTSQYNPVELALNNVVSVASVFRKKAWEAVGGYNPNMKDGYEDWNFWISIVGHGYTWSVLQEPLFFYRVRKGSMITKSRLKHTALYSQLMRNNKEFFQKNMQAIIRGIEKRSAKKNNTSIFALLLYGLREIQSNGLKSFFQRAISYFKNRKNISGIRLFIEAWHEKKRGRGENSSYIRHMDYDRKRATIVYIIPGVGLSGGVAVVLQHANRLFAKGYDVKILSQDGRSSIEWFRNQKVPVIPFREEFLFLLGEIDVLIATSWTTAPFLETLTAKRKIYFVQSDERRFSSADTHSVELIDETYRIDCEYMTEALWIRKWLKEEFGHKAAYVPNGIDPEMFHLTEQPMEPKGKKLRILIEGSIDVPFKGMDDAYSVVKDINCELWVVSSNGEPKSGWRYDRFFRNVPIDEMKKIYSSCDILLKMSRVEGFFGPPMEAMACGCSVVVGKVTGYDEYIVDEHNALVVEQGDIDGARKAVERLISDAVLREKLIANGYKTAKEWSWDRSLDLLEQVVSGKEAE